ncbi:hypothetical protein ALNOE001_05790 [Candidatus Methanobinarius endosymbioticus]|uniref:Gins51 C-terminal domain-containing protein n=1 Tax=Candidatus Methanobinarius endosymbioticus TaxID=2006182 RepID=A0A366MCR0_9EURY|nr:hypothetical protein ALNOE001_05790 [Candidatus Methanobinarius endosymbioticus]
MDDQFFTKLREIQKKERANSSLARVGSDFYKRTHKYLDSIRDVAVNDPFSEESDLLKNVQRIATEICEIREHKIADAAVMNIHRSYHLFQGKPQFDLVDTTPLNITEEEEKLYFSFIDVLKAHRRAISLDQLTTDDENITDSRIEESKPKENNVNDIKNINKENLIKNDIINETINKIDNDTNDQVLNRLNNIKSAKVLENEVYESIDKQIVNTKNHNLNKHNLNKSDSNSIIDEKNLSNKDDDSNSPVLSEQQELKISESSKSKLSKSIKSESNKFESTNNNSIGNKDKIKNNNHNENLNGNNSSNKMEKSFKSSQDKFKKDKNFELANVIGNEEDQFINLDKIETMDDFGYNNVKNINNSRSTVDNIVNAMLLIFSDINSIIGVDEKIYGPFKSQDIVIMPDINADILVKSKKGRLVKI